MDSRYTLSGNLLSETLRLTPLPQTPRFLIRLPQEIRVDLEQAAKAQGRSLSNLIVQILREWLAAHPPQS